MSWLIEQLGWAPLQQLADVVVLAGGRSAEKGVSQKSGAAILQALQKHGVKARVIDPALQPLEEARGASLVFIALHGRGGEDGTVQGALEFMQLPYTGSGVMASAMGMDKICTKQIWLSCGLPTPAYWHVSSTHDLPATTDFPLMVKPAREGSSIGMKKVHTVAELENAIREALVYDQDVLVEQWITGSEYTVAILGEVALPAIRLETPNHFYDYEAKYELDTTSYFCPCGLTEQEEQQLQQLAIQAFNSVRASGWGRVDVMRNQAGEFFLLEVNTVPGMTDHSLVPMAAQAAGLSFDQLVGEILLNRLQQKNAGVSS